MNTTFFSISTRLVIIEFSSEQMEVHLPSGEGSNPLGSSYKCSGTRAFCFPLCFSVWWGGTMCDAGIKLGPVTCKASALLSLQPHKNHVGKKSEDDQGDSSRVWHKGALSPNLQHPVVPTVMQQIVPEHCQVKYKNQQNKRGGRRIKDMETWWCTKRLLFRLKENDTRDNLDQRKGKRIPRDKCMAINEHMALSSNLFI